MDRQGAKANVERCNFAHGSCRNRRQQPRRRHDEQGGFDARRRRDPHLGWSETMEQPLRARGRPLGGKGPAATPPRVSRRAIRSDARSRGPGAAHGHCLDPDPGFSHGRQWCRRSRILARCGSGLAPRRPAAKPPTASVLGRVWATQTRKASYARRTISTFSLDIAHAVSRSEALPLSNAKREPATRVSCAEWRVWRWLPSGLNAGRYLWRPASPSRPPHCSQVQTKISTPRRRS